MKVNLHLIALGVFIMANEIVPFNDDNPIIPRQAENDEQVMALWLHNRPRSTQRVYLYDVSHFTHYVQKRFPEVILRDLQGYSDYLEDRELMPSTVHRMLSAIKSLIAFAHRIGYLRYDVGKALRLPKFKDNISERILSEAELQKMIGMETNLRNQLILRVLYATALRVSEFGQLKWGSLIERENGGQTTVLAKGEKTHTVLILEPLWNDLLKYKHDSATNDTPVFPGRNNKPLSTTQIWRIVKRSAKRAGITKIVSPHVLRACHATHAIEHNCPIHIVQSSLNHSNVSVTSRYLRLRETDSSSKYLTI